MQQTMFIHTDEKPYMCNEHWETLFRNPDIDILGSGNEFVYKGQFY